VQKVSKRREDRPPGEVKTSFCHKRKLVHGAGRENLKLKEKRALRTRSGRVLVKKRRKGCRTFNLWGKKTQKELPKRVHLLQRGGSSPLEGRLGGGGRKNKTNYTICKKKREKRGLQ